MPSPRVSKELNNATYFMTLTIKNLYYIFDRYNRWEILAASLQFCQKEKNLKIHAFVFMLNHIHLIIESEDVAGFLRDFKRYTAQKMFINIKMSEPNILKLFKVENTNKYEFWAKTNMPKFIETEHFFLQKKEYIEQNPVKKQYVMHPEDWYWSSANKFCELKANNLLDP